MFSTGIALDNHCVGQPRHCVGQPRVRAVAAPGGRGVAVVKAEENSRFPSGMTTKMQQQKQRQRQEQGQEQRQKREHQRKWWAHARSGCMQCAGWVRVSILFMRIERKGIRRKGVSGVARKGFFRLRGRNCVLLCLYDGSQNASMFVDQGPVTHDLYGRLLRTTDLTDTPPGTLATEWPRTL